MLVFNPIQAEQLVLEFFPQKITELNNALKASHCILENLVPSTVQQGGSSQNVNSQNVNSQKVNSRNINFPKCQLQM